MCCLCVSDQISSECECSEIHQCGGYTRDGTGQTQQQTGVRCKKIPQLSGSDLFWTYNTFIK